MSRSIRSVRECVEGASRAGRTVLALGAILAVILAAIGGGAAAASAVTVGPADSVSVDEGDSASVALTAADIADPDGVGAFAVEIEYDPAVVSLDASAAGDFAVETGEPSSGVLRIVGYVDESTGPTGDVALATLSIEGESAGQSALDVTVETLADADGDPLANATSSRTVTVVGSGTPAGNGGTGGDGGAGGSGSDGGDGGPGSAEADGDGNADESTDDGASSDDDASDAETATPVSGGDEDEIGDETAGDSSGDGDSGDAGDSESATDGTPTPVVERGSFDVNYAAALGVVLAFAAGLYYLRLRRR